MAESVPVELPDPSTTKKKKIWKRKGGEPPEEKAKRLMDKAVLALESEGSCVMYLHEVYPRLEYKFSGSNATFPPQYSAEVEFEGVVYQAESNSKKKAKSAVCEKVLRYIVESKNLGDMVATGLLAPTDSSKTNADQLPSGKSPMQILTTLRPKVSFEVLSIENVAAPPTVVHHHHVVKVSTTVDGIHFEAEGHNKKMARAKLAEEVLKSLFGLHCVPGPGGMPVYTGDDSEWTSLLPTKSSPLANMDHSTNVPQQLDFELPQGKNPVMFLYELYPDAVFNYSDEPAIHDTNSSHRLYIASIKLEDFDFYGQASTKKVARHNAAVAALTAVNSAGILAQRIQEKADRRPKKSKKRAMVDENNDNGAEAGMYPGKRSDLGENGKVPKGTPVLRNAVMKLNELRKGILYEDKSHSVIAGDAGMTLNVFTVQVVVDEQVYEGSGQSKKIAKMICAEEALRGLGLWTEEDDAIKVQHMETSQATAIAKRRRQAQNALIRGVGNRGGFGRGGGFHRGRGGKSFRQHQPQAWVTGGLLHSNSGGTLFAGDPSGAGYYSNPQENQSLFPGAMTSQNTSYDQSSEQWNVSSAAYKQF